MLRRLYPLGLILLPLLLHGCLPASRSTHTAAANYPVIRETMQRARSSPSLGHDRRTVLTEAERWIGVPYQFGGNTRSGVDCSGFVCNVFRSVEKKLPRNSAEQAQVGESVSVGGTMPGDLVFFNTTGSGVSHVGIIVEGSTFIHASTSMGVTLSNLSEPYYRDRLLFARRVLQ